ncbi:MAG TPA: choice-of-anchor Q domain-containing protein, partial [Bacteroidia bacterium]|nr:choice-of-anchor Q domain-containing protein [Bacteroidia bacterium]
NNGTSWANAYVNLQTAINLTPAGDTLWVANGHYYPGPSGDNLAWFDIKIGVTMLGGFQGLNGIQETSASQRNFNANVTYLSGDLDKSGGHSAADAYHVVNSAGKDTTAVVDGFTIEWGNAIGPGGHSLGGGIFSFGGGGSYYNCIIQNNTSSDRGAGIHAIGNFNFKRCLFRNNHSGSVGGAMSQSNNSVRIRMHNCAFVGNTAAAQAGAVYAEALDFQLFNCTFTGNSANVSSCLLTTSNSLLVRNCIMWGNPGPEISGPVPNVSRCIIEGGYAMGTNILNINPEFSDAVGRIRACSPAVDAGDSLLSIFNDFDGNPRPFDGDGNSIAKWDLGAYEVQVPRAFPAANSIVGPSPACANSFNNLYRVGTDNSPQSTYQWSLGSGGSIASGATNDSVRVNWGGTLGSHTLTVIETNALTGCSTTNNTSVTLNPAPTVSLTPAPNDSICFGDSVLVTANGIGVSRQWYRNGILVPGATANTIQASQAGYYNCIVMGANGCGDSAGISLKLYLRPLPTVTFSTSVPVPICQGDLVTITGSPGASHQWFRNGSLIGGATNNAYTTGLAGIYNMRQTDIHGCRDSAAAGLSLLVNALPVVTVTPSNIDTICIGDSLAISATASNAVSRQWFRSGSPIASSNVNPYQAMLTGVYNCRITDTNGCRDSAATGHRLVANDFINPVAACQNISVHLNAGGTATLTPAMLDAGSTDNCRIASYGLSTTTMTCAQLGSNAVTLTVTDFAARTSACVSTVTVLDSIRPTVSCANATVYLGANGQLTLNPAVVGGASTDN